MPNGRKKRRPPAGLRRSLENGSTNPRAVLRNHDPMPYRPRRQRQKPRPLLRIVESPSEEESERKHATPNADRARVVPPNRNKIARPLRPDQPPSVPRDPSESERERRYATQNVNRPNALLLNHSRTSPRPKTPRSQQRKTESEGRRRNGRRLGTQNANRNARNEICLPSVISSCRTTCWRRSPMPDTRNPHPFRPA